MSNFKVQRSNLSDQVISQIHSYIEIESLKPGDLLPPETELADLFGVSRTVIRESLSSLNATGVIETQSGRRPVVSGLSTAPLINFFNNATRLDDKAIREFIEVRKALMIYMIEQASVKVNDDDLKDLKKLCKRVKKARSAGPTQQSEHDESDRLFYEKLSDVCGNSVLVHMIGTLRDALNEKVFGDGGTIDPSLKQAVKMGMGHCKLVDAIALRDPAKAKTKVQKHFDRLLKQSSELSEG